MRRVLRPNPKLGRALPLDDLAVVHRVLARVHDGGQAPDRLEAHGPEVVACVVCRRVVDDAAEVDDLRAWDVA